MSNCGDRQGDENSRLPPVFMPGIVWRCALLGARAVRLPLQNRPLAICVQM